MKFSISLVFLLALFFLPSTTCDNLINKTCNKTSYYDLCVSTLQLDPQSNSTDVKGLASIMANATLSNATNILNYTAEVIKNNTDPELERRLTYCAEVYISLVHDILPQAIDQLANDHFGFSKYGISVAEDEANECEKKIPKSFESPLTQMNIIMQNLCDVCVSIINILLKS